MKHSLTTIALLSLLATAAWAEPFRTSDRSTAPTYTATPVTADGDRSTRAEVEVYSNMLMSWPMYDVPSFEVRVAHDDYYSIADGWFQLCRFDFIGGVRYGGQTMNFEFYDTAWSFVDSFSVALPWPGIDVWTIDVGGSIMIPDAGYVHMWADDLAIPPIGAYWSGNCDQPTVGYSDPMIPDYSGYPACLQHKFALFSHEPTGACCDWAGFTCQDDVLEDDCDGLDEEWTAGTLCTDLDPPCLPTYEVTIVDDYSYPQKSDYDYGLESADIELSNDCPAPGETVTITAHVQNYGLCTANSPWGYASATGRACWGEWDFYYPTTGTVDISYRCWDQDATVEWRVELDGVHIADPIVPQSIDGECFKLVTIHDVPIDAGSHTIFLGTYQLTFYPDYILDWVEIGDVHIEGEAYDRMGGNVYDRPDWNGLGVSPRCPYCPDPPPPPLTVQIWSGDPAAGGTLLCEDCVGQPQEVNDYYECWPGEGPYTAHYIENDGQAPLVCDWTPTESGPQEIYVVVDPHDGLDEIDETNNVAQRTVVSPCQGNEVAKLLASEPTASFGGSVAISGDVAVIGRLWGLAGPAYVFRRDTLGWHEEATLLPSDEAAGFGDAVAISGDTAVIGAYLDDNENGTEAGSAYVFQYDPGPQGGWGEQARLLAEDGETDDWFGWSVAISGDTAVVGALLGDAEYENNTGSAYVFVQPSDGWRDMTETAKLTASDAALLDEFGVSVAISGDTAVIGAFRDDNENGNDAGSAHVFVEPGGGWTDMTETAKLTASDGAAGDEFGRSVAISGDTAVIGSYLEDNDNGADAGSAYLFEKPGAGWETTTETVKLTACDGAANDQFGWSAAISSDTAVIGAWWDDDSGGSSGSAYVFMEPGGGWEYVPSPIHEDAKLTASDGAAGDWFGVFVAISGDAAVIGADSGSAYVFGGLSDCNTNGTLDICDIADGTSQDVNSNGVPDECETAELSCVGSDQVIVPGATVSFDIFVADVTGLNAYQIDVEVVRTAGTGELEFTGCEVSDTRGDFVFFGLPTVVEASCTTDDLRIAVVALSSETVDVPDDSPAYLGTYTFDVSTNATNASMFELRIRPEPDSLLLDAQGVPHLLAPGPACETVVCEGLTVIAEGGRYLQVTPSPGEQAIRMTSPSCPPTWVKYVDANGCLVDTPLFLTAVEWDTVHITGDDIVPSFDFEVAAACGDVDTLSASSPATTWLWGDVDNDTMVNVSDIQKVVQCAEGTFYSPTTIYNADLRVDCPTLPSDVCDNDDVLLVLDAYRGEPYDESVPCGGKSTEPEGEPAQGDALITLVAADPSLGAGNVFVVDAFILSVADLRGYQLQLSIGEGSSGSLECEDLVMDTGRPDYVFFDAGVADWPWANLSLCRLASALTEGGINVGLDSRYLGTFMLRTTPGAEGSFSVQLAGSGSASFLRDSVRQPIDFDAVPVELTVVAIPGDIDLDADVDLYDYASFAVCVGGSGVTVPPVGCSQSEFGSSDIDADGDVDLLDYAIFTQNFGD